MKAVFDTKSGSGYDDLVVERYHFPNQYLEEAKKALGDWIVYREPRRNKERSGYVAVALLRAIEPDPDRSGHSYARLIKYLPFDSIVPLKESGRYFEARLREVPRTLAGATLQGRSVRTLPDGDFATIVRAGLKETFAPENAVRLELDRDHADDETVALLNAPEEIQERQIKQMLLNRRIRDANFRGQVCHAYEDTCAVTRLKIVNGGGKPEVQAAHIWAVRDGGPDIVQNGIALSGTVHWLFDRHLISLTDDYKLLVSHNKVPGELRSLFYEHLEQIKLPKDPRHKPFVEFIRKHREKWAIA
jgi:putative restriction endonuclease